MPVFRAFFRARKVPFCGTSKSQDKQVCQGKCRYLDILRCEEDLLCKSIEVLGETAKPGNQALAV